ncbi:MAG: transposase family protein [Gammaproteobacteria bacterium]|nr:transposase family protein [Gammaproteobacteria bacterium]
MNNVTTLGIDLAKNVFQLHGVDSHGRVQLRKQVRRAQLKQTIARLPPCVIGMEACASSQYWARQLEHFGHTVRLMSPHHVKPYVTGQKNDRSDAEGICEAVGRPSMRFVPRKSLDQQDMQSAHRVRQGWMHERTALINRVRGLLGEYGIVLPRSPGVIKRALPIALQEAENGLTVIVRSLLARLLEHLRDLEDRIRETERTIGELGSQNDTAARLQTIPGVGLLTATALFAAAGNAKVFKNGREMAA